MSDLMRIFRLYAGIDALIAARYGAEKLFVRVDRAQFTAAKKREEKKRKLLRKRLLPPFRGPSLEAASSLSRFVQM